MLRARHILPLVVPLLLILIPTVAYVIDWRSGAIPTRAEWESTAHSSGPWMGSSVQIVCIFLSIGGLIVTGCGVAFATTTGRTPQGWAIQGVGIVIASLLVFYFFGWLFE
jgi:hypothetical protein